MPRFLWRAAGIALAVALLPTIAGGSVPSVPLAQRSLDDPLLAIDRILDIDRVASLRGADAFSSEIAAAAVAGQAALAAAAAAAPSSALTAPAAGASGIPATVLAAYLRAEANLASTDSSCRLPWWVLAGIGRIESGHASGGRVDASGTTRGKILGPRLDGSLAGTAVIGDSDAGGLDGDPAFDRAVGPMQFLPGTWKTYARDGNADGRTDPHNIFDAATSAGVYLCGNGGDLSVPANLARAVFAYNPSQSYVDSVLSWGAAYRDGVSPVDDSADTVPPAVQRQPVVPAPKAPTPNRPPVLAAARGPAPAPVAVPAPAPAPAQAAAPAPTAPAAAQDVPGTSSADSPAVTDSIEAQADPVETQASASSSTMTAPPTTTTTQPTESTTTTTTSPTTAATTEVPDSTATVTDTDEASESTQAAAARKAESNATGTSTEQTPHPTAAATMSTTAPPPPRSRSATPTSPTSSGPVEVALPAVVGQSKEAAIAALSAAGFEKAKVVTVDDPSHSKGTVVSTEPVGGQALPVTTVITVKVASGNVEVPDLVGLGTADAERRVVALGLRYDAQPVESATVLEAQVVSQEQAPDTFVGTGTVVTVKVAVRPSAAATAGQSTAGSSAVPSRDSGGKAKRESGKGKKDGASADR